MNLEEHDSIVREPEVRQGSAAALNDLGIDAYRLGEYGRAAALHEEALALCRELGDRQGIATSLQNLGIAAQALREYGLEELYTNTLDPGLATGAQLELSEALEGMARIAVAHGQQRRAAQLAGAAEALREMLGAALPPSLQAGHERAVRALGEALGEAAFAAAWAGGRALPLEEAIFLALDGGPYSGPKG